MKFTAQQIAVQLEGTVDGDPDAEIYQLSKIEDAQKGSLTFLSNPKYTPFIYKTKASVTIVNADFIAESDLNTTLVRVSNAYDSFTVLLDYYNKVKVTKKGITKSAEIDDSVIIGKDCYVGAMTCIEANTIVEDNVKIFPQVFIGSNVSIGKGSIVFPGARILDDYDYWTRLCNS